MSTFLETIGNHLCAVTYNGVQWCTMVYNGVHRGNQSENILETIGRQMAINCVQWCTMMYITVTTIFQYDFTLETDGNYVRHGMAWHAINTKVKSFWRP